MSIMHVGSEGGRPVCQLPVSRIVPNPSQPRKIFDDYALLALASSIRQHGLLQPITVRARDNGYEIIMGERRYRACCLLGFTHIDAFIMPATEGESALLALIENLQREDLHYFEEAEAYSHLIAQGMTQEALARRLGKSASAIANKIRLLKLEPEVRKFLAEEGLSERHARALLSLPEGEARMRVASQAASRHMTVKEMEQLILKTQRRLPVPSTGRKVISLVRDHRLYANAIKNVVKQMQDTGMIADLDIQEGDGWIDMHIRMGR
ncbi:MAG: ParB/RepB/Spo0J family partition protein [Clostridia bacterium]|nr:ParB/RepB/Spo0J family partition protein [Clostridia bacterium]